MKFMRFRKNLRNSSGQSLVETALAMPMLLCIVLNAINFAYFFLMAVNLTASTRVGAMYSVQGSATPSSTLIPNAGPSGSSTCGTGTSSQLYVCFLTNEDMRGAVNSPTTKASLQVCSQANGITSPGTTTQKTTCTTYGPSLPTGFTFPTPASDPELNAGSTATAFLLNRVDIFYQFSPLIPGRLFNVVLLASPICSGSGTSFTCTFHRQSSMRVMN